LSENSEFVPRAAGDAGLTEDQVKELYQDLLREQDRVDAALRKHVDEVRSNNDETPADELDQSARVAEQAYLLRHADKEQKLLREIKGALEKLHTGEYGICEGTEEPIGYRRLKSRPWTRYCVEYKEQLERAKR
jgi:DnaK suppressor protein